MDMVELATAAEQGDEAPIPQYGAVPPQPDQPVQPPEPEPALPPPQLQPPEPAQQTAAGLSANASAEYDAVISAMGVQPTPQPQLDQLVQPLEQPQPSEPQPGAVVSGRRGKGVGSGRRAWAEGSGVGGGSGQRGRE